jgi:hypothetical protein
MNADDLTAALHACAAGIYPLEADGLPGHGLARDRQDRADYREGRAGPAGRAAFPFWSWILLVT